MKALFCLFIVGTLISCSLVEKNESVSVQKTVGKTQSTATTSDGEYISWKEHIIDDSEISGVGISGSDGLVMADLDKDGFEDIISVHESDTEYDGVARGHIRIAFGSSDPNKWILMTLAEGADAGAAEDAAVADFNGDGYLDIVAACELAHLIYFQNPGANARSVKWERLIPEITKNRGSFIRVFTADFNQDGKPEITAANKGDQLGAGGSDAAVKALNPISYFEIEGDPLSNDSWIEHELIRVRIPINSEPIDIDKDGDQDMIAGSRGENRIVLFENVSADDIQFVQHEINILGSAISKTNERNSDNQQAAVSGFNMDYVDLNNDGRLDIITGEAFTYLVWLEQPSDWANKWNLHTIGTIGPDKLVGIAAADINGDGYADFMTGGYSGGSRDKDSEVTPNDALGRLAWFEHPGDMTQSWIRHDISRRKRGMFDKFIVRDLDQDGDIDFVSTRGNSLPYDGVFWLEQQRSLKAQASMTQARQVDSEEMPLPNEK